MLGTVRLCNNRSYTKADGENVSMYQLFVEYVNDNNEEYVGTFYKRSPYEIGETVNLLVKSNRDNKPYVTIE